MILGIRRGARIGASAEPPSGVLAPPYGPGAGCVGCPTVAARRWAYDVEFTGVGSVHYFPESDVIRGDAAGLWSGTVPVGGNTFRGAISTCPTGGSLHGCWVFPRLIPPRASVAWLSCTSAGRASRRARVARKSVTI